MIEYTFACLAIPSIHCRPQSARPSTLSKSTTWQSQCRIFLVARFWIASHFDKLRSGGLGDRPESMRGCKGEPCETGSPLIIIHLVKPKPYNAGDKTKTPSPSNSPLTNAPFGFILITTEYVRAKFAARELCRRWAWWKHRGWNRPGTARAVSLRNNCITNE